MTRSKFIRAALVLGSCTALALLVRPTLRLRLRPDAALLFRARDVRIPVLQRHGSCRGPTGAISSMEELPALLERGPASRRNVFAATVTIVHLAIWPLGLKVIPCRPCTLFQREKAEGLSVYPC